MGLIEWFLLCSSMICDGWVGRLKGDREARARFERMRMRRRNWKVRNKKERGKKRGKGRRRSDVCKSRLMVQRRERMSINRYKKKSTGTTMPKQQHATRTEQIDFFFFVCFFLALYCFFFLLSPSGLVCASHLFYSVYFECNSL